MFSPEAASRPSQGSSSRNPRRRQRDNNDSSQQQPLRKRSKLSDETFVPPTVDLLKDGANGTVLANGHGGPQTPSAPVSAELEVRLRDKKRTAKGDGSTVLTRSPKYIVKHIPNIPEQLKNNKDETFRASVHPATTYALALTRESALVWDYASLSANPVPHVLPLPFAVRPGDALPYGSIVTSGASGELGLVVVSSTSGKIRFWENVESAESLGLFRESRQGIDGSVPLASGESLVGLVDAEHAGFILMLSTGRLGQLTLRDPQGKPSVNVQLLQQSLPSNSQGLLGRFGNIFAGNAWRKDTAAVKCRLSPTKGQVQVIAATAKGDFATWDISWSGHQTFGNETQAQKEIILSLRDVFGQQVGSSGSLPVLHDFAILTTSKISPRGGSPKEIPRPNPSVLALVSVQTQPVTRHALVELMLAGAHATVSRVISLKSRAFDARKGRQLTGEWTPRLLVPRPGHTAHIILESAIVVASLTRPEESADSQLLGDSGKTFQPFQDVIRFSNDPGTAFAGCQSETGNSRSTSASSVILTQGFGAIRMVSPEPANDDSEAKNEDIAKVKIEQAVFATPEAAKIIDLLPPHEIEFTAAEIGKAACNISRDILDAENGLIPETATIEHHLELKASALSRLITLLRGKYPPLSRPTVWQLLQHADKVATAQVLWKRYEQEMKDMKASASKRVPIILLMWRSIDKRFKTVPDTNSKQGEQDFLRLFFIKNVRQIEVLTPWTYWILHKQADKDIGADAWLDMVQECVHIYTMAVQTALEFRIDKAERYGLQDAFDAGLLATGYRGLPQFSTSTLDMVENGYKLAKLALQEVLKRYSETKEPKSAIHDDQIYKLTQELPDLVKAVLKVHIEQIRYFSEHPAPEKQVSGRQLRLYFEETGKPESSDGDSGTPGVSIREDLLVDLYGTGKQRSAFGICEELGDMSTLAKLLVGTVEGQRAVLADRKSTSDERDAAKDMLRKLDSSVEGFFRKFGNPWAYHYFDRLLEEGTPADVFRILPEVAKEPFERWLNQKPQLARMRWINDVKAPRQRYLQAARDLFFTATENESNVWSKKVELSIASLSLLADKEKQSAAKGQLLAASEQHQADSRTPHDLSLAIDAERQLTIAQDMLYYHVRPVAYDALDESTAVELIMQAFAQGLSGHAPSGGDLRASTSGAAASAGKRGGKQQLAQLSKRGRPALHTMLAEDFDALRRRRALTLPRLVDMVTLIDDTASQSKVDDIAHCRFNIALQALGLAMLAAESLEGRTKPKSGANGHITNGVNGTGAGPVNNEVAPGTNKGQPVGSSKEACETMIRLTWKRLYIRDDWMAVNNTKFKLDGQVRGDVGGSILYQTIQNAIRDDLFTKHPYLSPPAPEDVMGAASTDEQMRLLRFPDNPDLRAPLAVDNARDDEVLRTYCERARLGHWVAATLSLAKEEVEAAAAAADADADADDMNGVGDAPVAADEAVEVEGHGVRAEGGLMTPLLLDADLVSGIAKKSTGQTKVKMEKKGPAEMEESTWLS